MTKDLVAKDLVAKDVQIREDGQRRKRKGV
jgi:hypothetical protein